MDKNKAKEGEKKPVKAMKASDGAALLSKDNKCDASKMNEVKPQRGQLRSDGVVFNYTENEKDAIFEEICTSVIKDRLSFNKAVDQSEITLMTFYTWLIKSETRKELYNYAREVRCDILFEEIADIADTQEKGETIIEKPAGTEVKTGDMIEHRRLRVDARKWVVARMNPKKYGDKLDVTTDNKAINQHTVDLSPEAVALLINKL